MLNHPGYPPLDEQSILSSLHTHALGRHLLILPEVSSTNAHALTLTHTPVPHGTAVIAEHQTAGRGRLNRTWFSPPGLNLYTSIILNPPPHFERISWIPLIAGLAITDSIYLQTSLPVSLKWPNDLLCDDKKIGGILCEGISHGNKEQVVVVGIGINVHMRKEDFPLNLQQASTSLAMVSQATVNRNILLASFLNAFEHWYDLLLKGPITHIHHTYMARCETIGRKVLIQLTNQEEFVAIGHTIGEDGSLHVCLKDTPSEGIRVIHSGDVTHLRRIDPGAPSKRNEF